MHVQEMIASHPVGGGISDGVMIACIEACYDCGQACTVCADACLGEPMVKDLVACIRLNLDCADICAATGRIVSRRSGDAALVQTMIAACAEACRRCAEECERHADRHDHCRICAAACRECESACRDAADPLLALN
jgi:hypothetical protein